MMERLRLSVQRRLLTPDTALRLLLLVCLASGVGRAAVKDRSAGKPGIPTLSGIDNALIDDISRRAFRYFFEQTNLNTGLVLDRALAIGEFDSKKNEREGIASIAATGFGLTAYCIAADHRWIGHEMARQRVIASLRFFANSAPHEHGWFYHFMDAATGERRWHSEISSIDTAILLAGVLTARQFFQGDA